jgi:hypothetical protein
MVFVDDATGRLMHLQFVESESTFSYFHATRAYLNTVHFTSWIAVVKSILVVGCGVRGRSG